MTLKGKPPLRSPSAPRQRMKTAHDLNHARQAGEVAGDDTQLVGSVIRAMQLLNAFKSGDGPLGNVELSERTGLTKPTVSRLAYTLVRCGYLSYNPRYRVYELGPSAMALGNVALSSMDVRQLARPRMQELARQANFNVGLGTRENELMVFTDACEGEALVGLRLFAGSRIPLLTSAMGRAYLTGVGEAERESVLQELRPRYGDEWTGLERAVRKAVKDVAAMGFCLSVGEWQKDIHGVGAPIRHPAGGRVYALTLAGPAYLLPEKLLREELGPQLAAVASEVESALSPKAAMLPGSNSDAD